MKHVGLSENRVYPQITMLIKNMMINHGFDGILFSDRLMCCPFDCYCLAELSKAVSESRSCKVRDLGRNG